MSAIKTGYVITTDTASLSTIKCDEIWLITRGGKDIPNTIRVRGLAPSETLFNKYLNEWRERDPELWWPLYEKQFSIELEAEEKLIHLRKLWKLVKQGKVIALACFCKDSRYCHRTIIAHYLNQAGVYVEEVSENSDAGPIYKQLTLSFEAGEN